MLAQVHVEVVVRWHLNIRPRKRRTQFSMGWRLTKQLGCSVCSALRHAERQIVKVLRTLRPVWRTNPLST